MVFTVAYNNYYCTIENCIGTWNSNISSVDQPYAIFGCDRFDGSTYSHSKWLGNIAYRLADQSFEDILGMFYFAADDFYAENCLAFIEDGARQDHTFRCFGDIEATGFKAKNLTSIGGLGAEFIKADVVNLLAMSASKYGVQNASLTDYVNVYNNAINFYNGTPPHWFEADPKLAYYAGSILRASLSPVLAGKGKNGEDIGANIWYRYKDGVLTNEPLWPWPMNQRIIDAMIQSGREPVDVTKTIFELGGVSTSTTVLDESPPAPPTGLTIVQ